ncbi:MAG: sulfotransferase [Myxococcales bacterium]|nr:sulfotransferase [Myxococcales bacterium]
MTAPRETSTAYTRPYRPRLVAAANRLGRLLPPQPLDERSLLATARRRSGGGEFLDLAFLPRLRALLSAIDEEARLHPFGRLMARENLLRMLGERLKIDAATAREPTLAQAEVRAPVFVVGLQRTGTTLLHRLLACDPALRPLRSWEALYPAPPTPGAPDRRLRKATRAEQALRYLAPDFFAIHPVEARAPEEDVLLFDYGFWSTSFEATFHVPSFSRALEAIDHVDAYRDHRRILQLLARQRPGPTRWLNKTPHHLEHLDALWAVYPDARVIHTHRDPARALASFCSMVCHGRGLFSDVVDPCEVGRHWLRKNVRLITRALEARDHGASGRCLDVGYQALMADPAGVLRQVYGFLELPFSAEAERRALEFLGANHQHKHGRHRYQLEDFGLSASQVDEGFAAYRARFEV